MNVPWPSAQPSTGLPAAPAGATAAPPRPQPQLDSRRGWLLLAVFCGFVEFAGASATNGRVTGWGDVAFILVFAVVGVTAFINALRLLWRAV